MTTSDIQQARGWAERLSEIEDLRPGPRAAIRVIQSLPDQWVDAEKLREVVSKYEGNRYISEIVQDFADLLPAPKLPTLADMTQEEREACQWMQADVKLSGEGSVTCVIADPRMPGAKVRVWAPHGGSDDIEAGRVTPLPDLPKLKWPGSEPESTHFDNLPEEAKQVMKEYIEDFKAGRFVDFDLEESDSDQSPRPEGCCGKCPEIASGGWDCTCEDNPRCSKNTPNPADVPGNEPWLLEIDGNQCIGTRLGIATARPWSVAALNGAHAFHVDDSEITLIHKLVPEPPALPEGMRLADHKEYGRVVVSPKVDEDGDYKVFYLDKEYKEGATYEYAHPSDLTFLGGDQHV